MRNNVNRHHSYKDIPGTLESMSSLSVSERNLHVLANRMVCQYLQDVNIYKTE